MKDLKIGVIGGGTVGRAVARTYLEHVKEVRIYDLVHERRLNSLGNTLLTDIVFICVPESALKEVIKQLEVGTENNFVIKSTVPIGTTKRLRQEYDLPNLVHSPEFLTERCAMTDAQMPAVNIVGRVQLGTAWVERSICSQMLGQLYLERFPGIGCLDVTSDESEALKLFLNGFFATKVAYFNEIHSLTKSLNLDWEFIRMGMLADGRVGHSHTHVPGPDGKYGFGGKCLPKDLETLSGHLESIGQDYITRATITRNEYDREVIV